MFANDFLPLFDRPFQRKRKKSCFFKSEKYVKYVLSNTAPLPHNQLWPVFT